MNIIVKKCLNEHIEPIYNIGNAVIYVKSSTSRFTYFKLYIKKVKIDHHGLLNVDFETKWNSTYTMQDTNVNFEKTLQ